EERGGRAPDGPPQRGVPAQVERPGDDQEGEGLRTVDRRGAGEGLLPPGPDVGGGAGLPHGARVAEQGDEGPARRADGPPDQRGPADDLAAQDARARGGQGILSITTETRRPQRKTLWPFSL